MLPCRAPAAMSRPMVSPAFRRRMAHSGGYRRASPKAWKRSLAKPWDAKHGISSCHGRLRAIPDSLRSVAGPLSCPVSFPFRWSAHAAKAPVPGLAGCGPEPSYATICDPARSAATCRRISANATRRSPAPVPCAARISAIGSCAMVGPQRCPAAPIRRWRPMHGANGAGSGNKSRTIAAPGAERPTARQAPVVTSRPSSASRISARVSARP